MSFYKINPAHRKALGSADLLMLYLHVEFKANGKEFSRKDADLANDLGMTLRELRLFRTQLTSLGVINMIKRGCPPTWYYSVNTDRFNELVINPPIEKPAKRQVNQPRENGKFAGPLNRYNGTSIEPLQRYNEVPSERYILNRPNGTITDRVNGTSSLSSIDSIVDKHIDGPECVNFIETIDFFEVSNPEAISDPYTIIGPDEPKPPSVKVFDLPENEREEILQNLKVSPNDREWLFWLFGQEESSRAIETALMNIRGKDQAAFEKNTALYVLYCREERFRKNLTSYLFTQKYLETPTDRREKPKLTKAEENMKKHFESMAETYQKLDQLKKNGNS